jgi:hypothetical protein
VPKFRVFAPELHQLNSPAKSPPQKFLSCPPKCCRRSKSRMHA